MQESPVGSDYARTRDIVAVAVVVALLATALVTLLVQAWPPPTPPGAQPGVSAAPGHTLNWFGWRTHVSRDKAMFLVVLAAGALGACVHVSRSLYWYVGNRSLRRSWLMMYLTLPFAGALLGLIVYLVLRGGLVTGAGGADDVNPYGIAAIAALVGLFSRETSEKLRAVFTTLLAPAQQGRDQAMGPQVRGVDPADAAPGETVRITGVGLASATAVRFGAAEAPVTGVTDTGLTTTVPADAATGRLVVRVPGGSATSPDPFTVRR
ncbi:IPT/TIG domain-containing protein [Actinomadura oligospora]|uniref:IPT/TIG domain-containing protein n=1 Tax=Actinomadura oligospora TaxID=111804 RepID=UPI0004B2805D|nr:IPT/TIG domain-containing protein [Actinomadura oligospora]